MTTPALGISVNGNSIEEAIVRAVVESSIGPHLKRAVEEVTRQVTQGYPSMVKKAVEEAAMNQARAIVRAEFEAKLDEQVRALLTDDLAKQVVNAIRGRIEVKIGREW